MEGDRQQKAPALESRDTAYASNSRADRVQGKKKQHDIKTVINGCKCISLYTNNYEN